MDEDQNITPDTEDIESSGVSDSSPDDSGILEAAPEGEIPEVDEGGEGELPEADEILELSDEDLAELRYRYGDKEWTAKELHDFYKTWSEAAETKQYHQRYVAKMAELDADYKRRVEEVGQNEARYQSQISDAQQKLGYVQNVLAYRQADPIGWVISEINADIQAGRIPWQAYAAVENFHNELQQLGVYNPAQAQQRWAQVQSQQSQSNVMAEIEARDALRRLSDETGAHISPQIRTEMQQHVPHLWQQGYRDYYQILRLAYDRVQTAKPSSVTTKPSARKVLERARKSTTIRTQQSTGSAKGKEPSSKDFIRQALAARGGL